MRDVLAVNERKSIGFVTVPSVSFVCPKFADASYLTRSNTETLLPTGESKQVPSGVKSKFPWR